MSTCRNWTWNFSFVSNSTLEPYDLSPFRFIDASLNFFFFTCFVLYLIGLVCIGVITRAMCSNNIMEDCTQRCNLVVLCCFFFLQHKRAFSFVNRNRTHGQCEKKRWDPLNSHGFGFINKKSSRNLPYYFFFYNYVCHVFHYMTWI